MKVTQRSRKSAALIAASVILSGIVSGCGSGGGAAAVSGIASNTASTDTKANPETVVPAQPPTGCTSATYSPNYAKILSLYRWSSQPVRVRFLNSGVITKNDGTQADLQTVALQGFAEWASATNNGFSVQVTTDPAQATVTVHFGALPGVPQASDVLGLESTTLNSDNTIRSADILLNTWPSMSAANVDSFRETAAHEFGHALGINGHSDNSLDIMYAAHSVLTEKALTERDINTLRTDYCNGFSRSASNRAAGTTRVITND